MFGLLCRTAPGRRLVTAALRARSGADGASAGRRSGGHGKTFYRTPPQLTRFQVIGPEVIGGFVWFWVLWHFWHHPEEVLGHFPYPDPSKWTDEELGIPPDDEMI